jgi:hypothetical protein
MPVTPYRNESVLLRGEVERLTRELDWTRHEMRRLGSFQTGDHSVVERILGGPLRFESTHSVPGRLTDNRVDHAMGVLAEVYDESGTITHVGRRFVWVLPRTQSDQRNIEVTLVERDDAVRVSARQKFTDMATLCCLCAVLAGLMAPALAVTISRYGVTHVIPIALAAVVASFFAARTLYARATRRHSRRLLAAADMIVDALRRNPTGSPVSLSRGVTSREPPAREVGGSRFS